MSNKLVDITNYEFLEKETLRDYDELNFKNTLKLYTEETKDMLSVALTTGVSQYTDAVTRVMDGFKSVSEDVTDLISFFDGIIDSKKLDDLPLTTKTYDISSIDKIRPKYLSQFTSELMNNVNAYVTKAIGKDDVKKQIDRIDSDLELYKKRLVKTTIPLNMPNKDIINMDVAVAVNINSEFISNNLLPFLRNVYQYIREMDVVTALVNNEIKNGMNDIIALRNTVDNYYKMGKLNTDEFRVLNEYLFKKTREYIQLCAYIAFISIKKVSLYGKSIIAYKTLMDKILSFFPEGTAVLHENVLNGELTDIDMSELVTNIINGDPSMLLSFVNKIYDENLSYIENCGVSEAMISSVSISYEKYHTIFNVLKSILHGFDIIRSMSKDPHIASDTVIEKAGFSEPFENRFAPLISDFSRTDAYEEQMIDCESDPEECDPTILIFSCMNEIRFNRDKFITTIAGMIQKIYMEFTELLNDLNDPDPLIYKNRMVIDDLYEELNGKEVSFNHFTLNVAMACIDRIKGINSILSNILPKTMSPMYYNTELEATDDVNYFHLASESYDEISDIVTETVFMEGIMEYQKLKLFHNTGMRFMMEEEDPKLATSSSATNDSNQTSQTTNQTKANTTKTNLKQSISSIVAKISKFFSDTVAKFKSVVDKQSGGNLSWLKKNRDAILALDFSKSSLDVVPYEKYVTNEQITTDINSVIANINKLTADTLKGLKTKKDVNAYLFGFMSDGLGNVENINETMSKYYKTKNQPLERVKYSGEAVKGVVTTMFDYCTAYYESLAPSLEDLSKKLQSATENKLKTFETITESVMFTEAEEKSTTSPSISMGSQPASNNGNTQKSTGGSSTLDKIKWISFSVQYYAAGVISSVRDRNYEYLKILSDLSKFVPKEGNAPEESSENAENTEQK